MTLTVGFAGRSWRWSALGVATLGSSVGPPARSPVASAAAGLGAGGEFHPLTPARVFDTARAQRHRRRRAKPRQCERRRASTSCSSPGDPGGLPSQPDVLAVVAQRHRGRTDAAAGWRPPDRVGPTGGCRRSSTSPRRDVPNSPSSASARTAPLGQLGPRSPARPTSSSTCSAGSPQSATRQRRQRRSIQRRSRPPPRHPVGPGSRRTDRRTPLSAGRAAALQIRAIDAFCRRSATSCRTTPASSACWSTSPRSTARRPNTFVLRRSRALPVARRRPRPTSTCRAARSRRTWRSSPSAPTAPSTSTTTPATPISIVDVLGYLAARCRPTTRQGRVVPLDAPFRAFDTRQPAFGRGPARLRHGRGLELRRLRRVA